MTDAIGMVEFLKEIYNTEQVETIGDQAFYGCSGLKTIKLHDIKKIGWGAFLDCNELTVHLPSTVEEVQDNAFEEIKHLYYDGNLPGAPWGAQTWN